MKMKFVKLRELLWKPTTIGFTLVYIACVILAGRCLWYGLSGMDTLYEYSSFFYSPVMILSVLAYLNGTDSFRSHTDEVLSAKKYPGYYQNHAFLLPLCYALLLLVTLLVVLVIASVSNDATDYFLGYFGKSFVYNLVLPLLISLGVAYLAARMGSGIGSAVLLVLYLLLTSPVFPNLTWYTKPTIPIDQILTALLRPFRIFYDNAGWVPSVAVGLQTGPSRGSLLLFWVLFLAAAICFSLLRRKLLKRVIPGFLALASLCCLVYACLPSGGYQRVDDASWNGVLADFYGTYSDQSVGLTYDEIDYTFTDYDMQVNFGRNLAVEATLQLHSDTPATQFQFTLYHGYRIRSLTGEDVALSWSRDGDIVTLTTQEPVTECTLVLSYRGSHKIFFADGDGAMLPGWFPWYPMAGRHQVILNFETATSGYNVFNRIETANIRIQTNAGFTTVTNLEETEEGYFVGTGDSISLIGGELLLLSNSQIKDCIPLEHDRVDTETWTDYFSRQWLDICDTLALYGVTASAGADSTILVAPAEISRFGSQMSSIAMFDDYILSWGNSFDIGVVSQGLFMRYNSDSYLASTICSWGGLQDTPQATCSQWLGQLRGMTTNQPILVALREALEAASNADKGEEAAQKIVQFLCQPGASGTEQAFLEGLRDLYDSN